MEVEGETPASCVDSTGVSVATSRVSCFTCSSTIGGADSLVSGSAETVA